MSVAKFWIFHSYFIAFSHKLFLFRALFFFPPPHVEVGFEIIIPFRNFRVCRHIESFMCSSRNLSFTIAITFYHSILQHNAAFAFQFPKKKFFSLSLSLTLFEQSSALSMLAYVPTYIISSFSNVFLFAAWKFHVIDFAKLILSDFEFLWM